MELVLNDDAELYSEKEELVDDEYLEVASDENVVLVSDTGMELDTE